MLDSQTLQQNSPAHLAMLVFWQKPSLNVIYRTPPSPIESCCDFASITARLLSREEDMVAGKILSFTYVSRQLPLSEGILLLRAHFIKIAYRRICSHFAEKAVKRLGKE